MIDFTAIKQAAIILPYRDGKILMQLRDDKEGIVFPGKWGFFSGRIERGETPLECAHRELYEELGLLVDEMHPISIDIVKVPLITVLYSYYFYLSSTIESIVLKEGYDFNLFSLEEINNKKLYSPKAGCCYPVISHNIIVDIANRCFSCVKESVETSNDISGNKQRPYKKKYDIIWSKY
ncbi:MAG: NUDIX domain-containing protein [Desulfamplus sp.]|nr:NUDIX domain-containing protein [Desulfamplus sp.]